MICTCGSDEYAFEIKDARGIFVTFACYKCEDKKTKGFRNEIFSNPNYHADEPIEPQEQ